jgi:hypothetical protein
MFPVSGQRAGEIARLPGATRANNDLSVQKLAIQDF